MKKHIENTTTTNQVINDAIANNFYGLSNEQFFIQKIVTPIKIAREEGRFRGGENHKILLSLYFKNVKATFNASEELTNAIVFLSKRINNDLEKIWLKNLPKVLDVKNLIECILISKSNLLSDSLSRGLKNNIDEKNYKIEDVIENIALVKKNKKRAIILANIFLVEDVNDYWKLNNSIHITTDEKRIFIEEMLKTANYDTIFKSSAVKDILMDTINVSDWSKLDDFLHNLSIEKLNFFVNLFSELRNETMEQEMVEKIDRAICLTLNKAIYTRKDELINRVIEFKEERPELTEPNFYVLMLVRFFNTFKKEKARLFADRTMQLLQKNGELEKVRDLLFNSGVELIIVGGITLSMKSNVFRNEMKYYFNDYLQNKIEVKKDKNKALKI